MNLNIALFGPGNVGTGIIDILRKKKEFIKEQYNIVFNIKYI